MFNITAWLKIACCCSIAWTNWAKAGSASNAAGLKTGNADAGSIGGSDWSRVSNGKKQDSGAASGVAPASAGDGALLLPLVPLAFRCGAVLHSSFGVSFGAASLDSRPLPWIRSSVT